MNCGAKWDARASEAGGRRVGGELNEGQERRQSIAKSDGTGRDQWPTLRLTPLWLSELPLGGRHFPECERSGRRVCPCAGSR